MSSFFSEMERIIATNSDNALEVALHYYGQNLQLFRAKLASDNPYGKVHGKEAGGKYECIKKFIGILQSDDFSPTDGYYSGNFSEGFLYTKEKGIRAGDVVELITSGEPRKFRVETPESIGYSTNLFVKFKLSNMN
jgi:hypothetical protein